MKIKLLKDTVNYVAEIKYNDRILDVLTTFDVIPGDYVKTNIDENLYEVIKIKETPKNVNKIPQIKVKECIIEYKPNTYNDDSTINRTISCYSPVFGYTMANVTFEPKVGDLVFIAKRYYYIDKVANFVYPNLSLVSLAYRREKNNTKLLMRSAKSFRHYEYLYDINKISKSKIYQEREETMVTFQKNSALFIADDYIFGYTDDDEINTLINEGRSNNYEAIIKLIDVYKNNKSKYDYWLKRKSMLEEEKQ